MSYNYDAQLIDSVRLGQARIEGALLFGPDRLKRQYRRRTGTFTVSFFLAVLACAGCVIGGWVMSLMADLAASRAGTSAVTEAPATEAPGTVTPGDPGVAPPDTIGPPNVIPLPTLTDPGAVPPPGTGSPDGGDS